MFSLQLQRCVQAAVYGVADAFGFQQFSLSPATREWVPATAALASDNVAGALRDALVRRADAAAAAGKAAGVRGGGGDGPLQAAAFEQAIADVHAELLQECRLWAARLGLPPPAEHQATHGDGAGAAAAARRRGGQQQPAAAAAAGVRRSGGLQPPCGATELLPPVAQLHELALWELLYCEAANLRHTPHVLCLLFYIMRGSVLFDAVLLRATALPPPPSGAAAAAAAAPPTSHWRFWLAVPADDFPFGGETGGLDLTSLRLCLLRQLHAACPPAFQYGDGAGDGGGGGDGGNGGRGSSFGGGGDGGGGNGRGSSFGGGGGGGANAAEEAALDAAANALAAVAAPRHRALVADLLRELRRLSRGGGCSAAPATAPPLPLPPAGQLTVLSCAVQPLFCFLAEQIDLAGGAGEEPAHRFGYDDVDEAACSPGRVARVVAALKRVGYAALPPARRDLWHALLVAVKPPEGWALALAQPPEGPSPAPPPPPGSCSGGAVVVTAAAGIDGAGAGGGRDERRGWWARLRRALGGSSGSGAAPDGAAADDHDDGDDDEDDDGFVIGSASSQQSKQQQQQHPHHHHHRRRRRRERYPRDAQRAAVLDNLALLLQRARGRPAPEREAVRQGRHAARRRVTAAPLPALADEPEALAAVYARGRHGADFWAKHLLRHKTFVEARSLAAPFVAFWRVYALHAAYLAALVAVMFVWRARPPGAAVDWLQVAAALAAAAVADAVMRAARAAARLLLLSYAVPTWRSVPNAARPTRRVMLAPFSPATWLGAVPALLELALWLAWAGVLAVCVAPVLARAPLPLPFALPGWLHSSAQVWLLPALAHAVVLWGGAAAVQRPGYVTSWPAMLAAVFCRRCTSSNRGSSSTSSTNESHHRAGGLFGGGGGGAHAGVASDPAVDALFFPARNLRTGRRAAALNAALWVAVFAVKVVFEGACVVGPFADVALRLLAGAGGGGEDAAAGGFVGAALDAPGAPLAANALAATSRWLTVAALAVPVVLVCVVDTGVLFSAIGALVSTLEGFRRGVGTFKTWSQLVSRFSVLLEAHAAHHVSRAALELHLLGDAHGDVQQLQLAAFAASWNALVLDLRTRDLVGTRELACLWMELLQLTPEQGAHLRAHGLATVLPARTFVAGAVPDLAAAVVGGDRHVWAAGQCYRWLLWVVWQCGLVDAREHAALLALRLPHPPGDRKQQRRWQLLLEEAVRLLRLLSAAPSSPSNAAAAAAAVLAADRAARSGLPVVPAESVPAGVGARGLLHGVPAADAARREAWRDLSAVVGRLLTALQREAADLAAAARASGAAGTGGGGIRGRKSGGGIGGGVDTRTPSVTHAELQATLAALTSLQARWAPHAARAAVAAAMPPSVAAAAAARRASISQGGGGGPTAGGDPDPAMRDAVLSRIAAVGAASTAVAQVVGWLGDALTLLPADAQPADDDARRAVLMFANSLLDPGLGVAPSVHTMPSLAVLVPHYDEDVTYALSAADAAADLGLGLGLGAAAGTGRLPPCLLTDDGAPTPTMTYIRSVFGGGGAAAAAAAAAAAGGYGGGRSQWRNFAERVRALALAQGVVADAGGLPAGGDDEISELHFLPGEPLHALKEELLLFCSWRGQLLARTVRGLDAYRAALAAQLDFENPLLLLPAGSSSSSNEQQQQRRVRAALLADVLDAKLSFVVSAQQLAALAARRGELRAQWMARGVRRLQERHPSLGVAFIDRAPLVSAARATHRVELYRDAAVLLATQRQRALWAASGAAPRDEAYRIRLPVNFESARGVILGEGKPENQNSALPFCGRAEVVQTLDANQDALVAASGLPLRNLLAEFLPAGWRDRDGDGGGGGSGAGGGNAGSGGGADTSASGGIVVPRARGVWPFGRRRGGGGALASKAPRAGPPGAGLGPDAPGAYGGGGRSSTTTSVAIVGFREWIFSEDSGALAEFAAATERSFGTTVQRLMAMTRVRLTYGHPDLFRRSFVATCGGVSKATRGLHVSEDVFGGYNALLRGRGVAYADYAAAGKGRDMGFESINTFEAKIAGGNGEQVIARDVRRLGHSLDLARLLSWYHTGNGFFVNTALTMLSVHAGVFALLLLALEGASSSSGDTFARYLAAPQLLQLGSLGALTFAFTLALEAGPFLALWTLARQAVQGSLLFFVFRAQTSAAAFTRDLLYGGAKYAATGRGYALGHAPFVRLFKSYGRTHFYPGCVLALYLAAVALAGHLTLAGAAAALWAPALVVAALLFSPVWFSPFSVVTSNVIADAGEAAAWLASENTLGGGGDADGGGGSGVGSWRAWSAAWWADGAANGRGRQAGRFAAAVGAHLVRLVPTLVLFWAAVSRVDTRADSALPRWGIVVCLAGGVLLLLGVIRCAAVWRARTALRGAAPRVVSIAAVLLLAGGVALSGFSTSGRAGEAGNAALSAFGALLCLRLLPLAFHNPLLRLTWATSLVDGAYRLADAAIAAVLLGGRFVLSLGDIVTGVQSQLLFSPAFARAALASRRLEEAAVAPLFVQALQLKRAQRRRQQQEQGGDRKLR